MLLSRRLIACFLFAVVWSLSILSPGVSRLAAAQTPGEEHSQKQFHAHPGHDHHWDPEGECHGWQDDQTGSCVHADIVDPAVSGATVPDGTEAYELEFVTEATSASNGYCSGAVPGNRFRMLYVTTQAREDRYASLAATLRDKVERADYYIWKSARQTGGGRHLRFVCDSGTIIVEKVILPNIADNSWTDTKTQLRNAGYNNSNRKYLAFLDWKEMVNGVRSDTTCGRGEVYSDSSAGQSNLNNGGNMIGGVYLRVVGCEQQWARTTMHEIGHMLGAVQQTSPNHDSQNVWHPRDQHDVMAYGGNTFIACGDNLNAKRYDCNDNDYFNTSPNGGSYLANNWNIARSQFLVNTGDSSPPLAPSNLTATAVSSTEIRLTWQDNSDNESGFKIERSTNGGVSWNQIATPSNNVTTYSNTGLSSNTTYTYRVRAYNTAGNSGFSNSASATTCLPVVGCP